MNAPIPDSVYVISLEEICWGGLLVAITMVLHGIGMLSVLRVNTRWQWWLGGARRWCWILAR